MRHVTTDTVAQDNETYKRFLEPNQWVLKPGDVLINSFSTGNTAGTMNAKEKFPQMNDDSVVYLVVPELPNIGRLDFASSNGWHVNKTELRVLGDDALTIKTNTTSSYGPVRLFGPKNFICKFENAQSNYAFNVNGEGLLKNHLIMFATEKNGTFRLSGFKSGGGGFSGLRLFEAGSDTDTTKISTSSGELTNFYIHDTISEGIYMGSIKKFHTRFVNTHIHNGYLVNTGSEWGQWQNISEGSIIENITCINSACEFPSPFQPNQVGGFQVKAGGGSFIIRNIYMENGGQPVINFFASAPVKDAAGTLIQEGSKPGDVYTIDNIICPKAKGNFLYVHSSCANGAEWVLDRIYCGRVTKRIASDTQTDIPYAFLYDVPSAVTDKLTIRSITTDDSLPLLGKGGQKYNIQSHTIGQIPFAKFVKPQPCNELLSFYDTYNQASQSQFYPVAGQPVKFKAGDITYKNATGSPKKWFEVSTAGDSSSMQMQEISWSVDLTQTPDSLLYNIVGVKQPELPPVNPCEGIQKQYDELLVSYDALQSKFNNLEMTYNQLKNDITAVVNNSNPM